MYKQGKGVKQDYSKAIEYFKKACELNNGNGCASIGLMYQQGKGIKQSDRKALEYFGKACDLKSQLGCDNYAKLKNKLI